MPKKNIPVKFTMNAVVSFDIRGEYIAPMHTRRDPENVACRFMKWLCDQKFFAAFTRSSGGGCWSGAFWPEDAEVVKKWLEKNGAEQIEEHERH